MQEETQLPLFGDPPTVPRRVADPMVAKDTAASRTDNPAAPVAAPTTQGHPQPAGAQADVAENARSLLALADVPGIGFATIRRLFDAYDGQLTRVWDAPTDDLVGHLHATRIPQPAQVARQMKDHAERLLRTGWERYAFLSRRRRTAILFRGMVGYPASLLDLPTPPAWLFVEGDAGLLLDPAIVAVVGTREPSTAGIDAAKGLSVDLVRSGCVILSGLAEGIDAIGHRTAVDYGAPTIAVLGHGVDVVFPASTAELRRQLIAHGGAVVSEYLLGARISGSALCSAIASRRRCPIWSRSSRAKVRAAPRTGCALRASSSGRSLACAWASSMDRSDMAILTSCHSRRP